MSAPAMDSSMVYGPRPAAMRARRMQAIYVPQSGATDVGGGTTIRINIGTAPAQYLLTSSTVLKFMSVWQPLFYVWKCTRNTRIQRRPEGAQPAGRRRRTWYAWVIGFPPC